MKITIETIPHNQQRYNTVGDWQFDSEGNLNIKVSELPYKYVYMIAVHELVEALLCDDKGISEKQVDAFDINYDGDYVEPGDDPLAPYHKQHTIATFIESGLFIELNVAWENYLQAIDELEYK